MKNKLVLQKSLEILGVSINDSQEVVQRAYRKKVSECHPDRNPGRVELEEKMKEVNLAYEVVKNHFETSDLRRNEYRQSERGVGEGRSKNSWQQYKREYHHNKACKNTLDDLIDLLKCKHGVHWKEKFIFGSFQINEVEMPKQVKERIVLKSVSVKYDCQYGGERIFNGQIKIKINQTTKSGIVEAYTENNARIRVEVSLPKVEVPSNNYWTFKGKQKTSLMIEVPVAANEARAGNRITVVLPEGKAYYEIKHGEVFGKEILIKYKRANRVKRAKMRICVECPDQSGKYPKSTAYKEWSKDM